MFKKVERKFSMLSKDMSVKKIELLKMKTLRSETKTSLNDIDRRLDTVEKFSKLEDIEIKISKIKPRIKDKKKHKEKEKENKKRVYISYDITSNGLIYF